MGRKSLLVVLILTIVVFSAVGLAAAPKTKLVVSLHSDFNKDKFKHYLAEYSKLHQEIEFDLQIAPFGEYLKKVQVAHMSGNASDIYHIYSLWGVELFRSGVIDLPPANIVADVKKNYSPVAVRGATIDGKIAGIPTEIDNYALVYNKKLLAEAGYTKPPQTWAELVQMAQKLTKYDKNGNIIQYGFTFLVGWDSAVVHPFLALLLSNGGEYLSKDYKKALFNSPAGVDALEQELKLFNAKATDVKGNVFDFPNGHIAMMIAFPAVFEGLLKQGMGDDYKYVGVAPIPSLKKHATILYTWFLAVDSNSKHKKEAWQFLNWLTAETSGERKTTRMGDYLVREVGALPSRLIDLKNHPDELFDQYTDTFVKELEYSVAEPNVAHGAEIKTILMNEIVEAWYGRKTAKKALDDAAKQVNEILAQNYQ